MLLCEVPGCRHERTPRGRLCESHKSTKRRHGDPQQRAISAAELQLYQKIVHASIRRNAESNLWGQLDTLWVQLIENCVQELLQQRQSGRPGIAWEREAQEQLARLKGSVEPREAVETILTMFVMQEFNPRRFKSDEAFRFQLVRRVRALSDLNVGVHYNHATRKTKRVYRDLRPRTVQVLAGYLIDAFGRAGLYIAAHERNRVERQGKEKAALDNALSELK